MTAASQNSPLAERELTITRVFDAPRALVFEAWTDPNHLAQWGHLSLLLHRAALSLTLRSEAAGRNAGSNTAAALSLSLKR
jgi:uncharacterized protein YndB with AHSA1/START domain